MFRSKLIFHHHAPEDTINSVVFLNISVFVIAVCTYLFTFFFSVANSTDTVYV